MPCRPPVPARPESPATRRSRPPAGRRAVPGAVLPGAVLPGAVLLAAVLGVLAVAGCAGPTVTDGGYRAKTDGTLHTISSALATAQLTMRLESAGRTAFALTDTSISQAESDAASAESSWETRQPPSDAALRLHDEVQGPIQDAVSALRDLRVAYRRGDRAGIAAARTEVARAAHAIDAATRTASG